MFALADHDGVLEHELNNDVEGIFAGLIDRMADVRVQDVHHFPLHGREPESVAVGGDGSDSPTRDGRNEVGARARFRSDEGLCVSGLSATGRGVIK